MKRKNISVLSSLSLTALLALCVVGCEDEPDKYEVAGGKPTINYVTAPKNPDSLLVKAAPNTRVCIVGDNLRSITKLMFNDQEATLNTSFITDHTLITSVPRALPDDPMGKIRAYTEGGDSVYFDFEVFIDAPKVTSASCTEAMPGQQITLNGDLFLSYDDPAKHMKVTFPGGVEVDASDFISLSQYAVTLKVPEAATEPGPITVQTVYGTGSSKDKFQYHEHEYYTNLGKGILFDFEEGCMTQQGWNLTDPKTSGGVGNDGGCLCLNEGGAKPNSDESANWDEFLKFEYWAGNWGDAAPASGQGQSLSNLIDMSKYPNLALRFEMKVPKEHPWTAGALQCVFVSYEYAQNAGRQNNTYIKDSDTDMASGWGVGKAPGIGRYMWTPWKEAANGEFHTNGEWITVTCPISEFNKGFKGGACETPLTEKDFDSLDIWTIGGAETGKVGNPELWYDNIRVVPYK